MIPLVSPTGYWDFITKGYYNTYTCMQGGSCNLTTVTIENLTVSNLTVTNFFNVSVTNIYINVTQLYGEHWVNESGDMMYGNLTMDQGTNGDPAIIFNEGAINKGFIIRGQFYGENHLFFDTYDGAEVITRMSIRRRLAEIEMYANLSMNDHDIDDVRCIEFDDGELCSSIVGNSTSEILTLVNNSHLLLAYLNVEEVQLGDDSIVENYNTDKEFSSECSGQDFNFHLLTLKYCYEGSSLVKITDSTPDCDGGTCWDGYTKAKLYLPAGVGTSDSLVKTLDEFDFGYTWTISCQTEGNYHLIVEFYDTDDVPANCTLTASYAGIDSDGYIELNNSWIIMENTKNDLVIVNSKKTSISMRIDNSTLVPEFPKGIIIPGLFISNTFGSYPSFFNITIASTEGDIKDVNISTPDSLGFHIGTRGFRESDLYYFTIGTKNPFWFNKTEARFNVNVTINGELTAGDTTLRNLTARNATFDFITIRNPPDECPTNYAMTYWNGSHSICVNIGSVMNNSHLSLDYLEVDSGARISSGLDMYSSSITNVDGGISSSYFSIDYNGDATFNSITTPTQLTAPLIETAGTTDVISIQPDATNDFTSSVKFFENVDSAGHNPLIQLSGYADRLGAANGVYNGTIGVNDWGFFEFAGDILRYQFAGVAMQLDGGAQDGVYLGVGSGGTGWRLSSNENYDYNHPVAGGRDGAGFSPIFVWTNWVQKYDFHMIDTDIPQLWLHDGEFQSDSFFKIWQDPNVTGHIEVDGDLIINATGGNTTIIGDLNVTGTSDVGYLVVHQLADSQGIRVEGFEDRSTSSATYSIDSYGNAVFSASSAFKVTPWSYIWLKSSSSYVKISSDDDEPMYFDAGGEFQFRDVDNGNAVVATIDSSTGNFTTIGNVTAENVHLPARIFAHTDRVMEVVVAGVWRNVTFDEEASSLQERITHIFNDGTNTTFTITDTGTYKLSYLISFEDSAITPDSHNLGRIVVNDVGLHGSLFEVDIAGGPFTDKDVVLTAPTLLAELTAGDEVKLQFTSDKTTVTMQSHATYGDHKDSATLTINRIP